LHIEGQRRTTRRAFRRDAVNIKTVGALAVMMALGASTVAQAAGNDEINTTPVAAAAENVAIAPAVTSIYYPKTKRPALLPAMYATLGLVQAWDLHSTMTALKAGAREANPVAAPFAGKTGSLVALKAATTAGTIFFAERMWRKNRVGAFVLMGVINGATAAVALHNMHNARHAAAR